MDSENLFENVEIIDKNKEGEKIEDSQIFETNLNNIVREAKFIETEKLPKV